MLRSTCPAHLLTYPVNALTPHGHIVGWQMGENADTDLYLVWCGIGQQRSIHQAQRHDMTQVVPRQPQRTEFFRPTMSAPWPPMECPVTEALDVSTGSSSAMSAGSSAVT